MANVEELLIKLTADNKDLKNKLNQSEKDVKGFGGQMKQVGLMAVAGFAAAGAAVLAFGVASFKAYEQQEQANKRLMFALKGNAYAYKELTKQAEKLRSETGVDDVAIMQIQQLGANAGYTTDKIKKITQASVELASVTGQDLQAAYMQINATLNGSAGRLTRLDAEFGTLTETQLKNGAAIDLVLQKYTGFAAESATELQKLSSNWDEFGESAGGVIAHVINPALEAMNVMMTEIANKRGFWQKLAQLASYATPSYGMIGASFDAQNAIADSKTLGGSPTYMAAQKAESDRAAKMIALEQIKADRLAKKSNGKGGAATKTNPFELESDMGPFMSKAIIEQLQNAPTLIETVTSSVLVFRESITSAAQDAWDLTEAMKGAFTTNDLESYVETLGTVASMFKENTTAYKVMASAQATISTWLAATNILANTAKLGPIAMWASFAATVAGGLGAVAKINGVAFAEGGVVSGPTNALIGEYAGARSNPEVVAPLDKLKSIMGGQVQRVEVYGYIDGDVIRLANKRSNYIADRRG